MNPFVFPSQVQHVFLWSEPKTPWWKVILHREPKNQRVMANTYDDYIDTHGVVFGLEAPLDFLDFNSNKTLVGVIE